MRVSDVMIEEPKVLPATAAVADVRSLFESSHVHLAVLVERGRLVTAISREDIPPEVADDSLAAPWGHLEGRVVHPDAEVGPVRDLMLAKGERRRIVTNEEGRLLGLLCLKHHGRGFCSDRDVDARSER